MGTYIRLSIDILLAAKSSRRLIYGWVYLTWIKGQQVREPVAEKIDPDQISAPGCCNP